MSNETLPARLPSRVLTTTDLTSDVNCSQCSSGVTVTPNPYFGTGLAVHRFIAMCNFCAAVTFVPEEVSEQTTMFERLLAYVRELTGVRASSSSSI